MIDSTNIRIIADNIRHLFKKVNSIEPGTVVEGNPSGSGFNTLLTKIKIGSNKYKLPKDVTANPEGEATETLSKLQIGSDIFGTGAGVTANPEGAATGSLSKLGIGSDIFSVFSGFDISTAEFDTGFKFGTKKIYGKKGALAEAIPNNTWVASGIAHAGTDTPLVAIALNSSQKTACPCLVWKNTDMGNTDFSVQTCRASSFTSTDIVIFYTK